MKLKSLFLVTAVGFLFPAFVSAQEAKDAKAEELEAKFKETMTAVIMTGRWCPLKDGVLGPEKEDKYTIERVEKIKGDDWVIYARLQYAKREVVVPIPVQVKWAGDTAVIIVDALQIPGGAGYGGNSYFARVLVHDKTYAGTWSGGDHGV